MSTLINVLTGINVISGLILLIGYVFFFVQIYRLYRRERVALFVGEDKLPAGYRVLSGKERAFRHDGGQYTATVEPMVRFGNKRFLLYRYNHADPIDVFDKENSRIEADVLAGILDNEVIKALNKPKFSMGLNWKTLVPVAIIVVVLIIIFSQGGV